MQNTKVNPIALVTKTLTSSQGAKVVHTQLVSEANKVSLKDSEILCLVSDCTNALLVGVEAEAKLTNALENFNKGASSLHTGGVRLADGRSKDKQTQVIRQAFFDGLTVADKTKQNYYEMFRNAVNSGKAIASFNYSSNAKKTGKGADTQPVDFEALLAKVINHPKFDKAFSHNTKLEFKDLLKDKYDISI
jgi:argonaute-like protein implicated in RNA metabolism and viral defense